MNATHDEPRPIYEFEDCAREIANTLNAHPGCSFNDCVELVRTVGGYWCNVHRYKVDLTVSYRGKCEDRRDWRVVVLGKPPEIGIAGHRVDWHGYLVESRDGAFVFTWMDLDQPDIDADWIARANSDGRACDMRLTVLERKDDEACEEVHEDVCKDVRNKVVPKKEFVGRAAGEADGCAQVPTSSQTPPEEVDWTGLETAGDCTASPFALMCVGEVEQSMCEMSEETICKPLEFAHQIRLTLNMIEARTGRRILFDVVGSPSDVRLVMFIASEKSGWRNAEVAVCRPWNEVRRRWRHGWGA